MKKTIFSANLYEKYFKRMMDVICSLLFLMFFFWVFLLIAILVRIKLGHPVIFKQPRPGKNGEIFEMWKFRTMTDKKDSKGNLLPDSQRLTPFGKKLRSTSLDELPEIWQILIGKMSILGPRPLLVRDMVFMSEEQLQRHKVRPGLSGLAQVMGRNCLDWEEKLMLDVSYVNNISFCQDVKLLLLTCKKVFLKEGISKPGMHTSEDYGDYLLRNGSIDIRYFSQKQTEAKQLIETFYHPI